MKDDRPDELLEGCGKVAHQLGLALAWTDGLDGAAAKRCSRSGQAAWKNARPLPQAEGAAVAFFATRARKRNPAVVASASNLVLIEFDGDLVELCAKYGLWDLPGTVTVRSRRGVHLYYRPPEGRVPLKVQVDESGVLLSEDGYTIGGGGLHATRHVYAYEHTGPIAELRTETYDRLRELSRQGQLDTRKRIANGDVVGEGQRHEALKVHVLQSIRDGVEPGRLLDEAHAFNRDRLRPELDAAEISRQVRGLVGWAARHPTEEERARTEAWRILRGEAPRDQKQERLRKREIVRRALYTVEAARVEYLVKPHLSIGTLILLSGIGGLGKTGLALALLAQATQEGHDVLVCSFEDPADIALRPRAEAAGADLHRVHVLFMDALDGMISLPGDMAELERHVRETNASALLIDPVSASISLKLDAHRDQDVRVVLGQLAQLAARARLSVVLVAHLNKAPSNDPYLRINGSTAFYNASRRVLTVTKDPGDPDWGRLVTAHKANYSELGDVERWRIEPKIVQSPSGPIETMVMRFVEIAEDVSREDVLATRSTEQDKLDEALTFLEDALADDHWHDSVGLKAIAGARRISERTLKRAARELHVELERRGFPATTWWRLPQSGQALSPDLGPTGDLA